MEYQKVTVNIVGSKLEIEEYTEDKGVFVRLLPEYQEITTVNLLNDWGFYVALSPTLDITDDIILIFLTEKDAGIKHHDDEYDLLPPDIKKNQELLSLMAQAGWKF